MKQVAKILGLASLAMTLMAPLLYLFQAIGDGAMKMALLLAMVLWFATAPFWMKAEGV
jgi:hypothetical protein